MLLVAFPNVIKASPFDCTVQVPAQDGFRAGAFVEAIRVVLVVCIGVEWRPNISSCFVAS